MTSILIRRGHGFDIISPGSSGMLPLSRRGNQQYFAILGGFEEQCSNVKSIYTAKREKVIINDIYGYSPTTGYFDVTYFGHHAVALGFFERESRKVFIPLREGMPIVFCKLHPNLNWVSKATVTHIR